MISKGHLILFEKSDIQEMFNYLFDTNQIDFDSALLNDVEHTSDVFENMMNDYIEKKQLGLI